MSARQQTTAVDPAHARQDRLRAVLAVTSQPRTGGEISAAAWKNIPKALPTSVKYRELDGLQKIGWDTQMKDSMFLRDIHRMRALEDEIKKIAAELSQRQPQTVVQMARENDYELLKTSAVDRVFLAVRPNTKSDDEQLIPLEHDWDTGLVGINLKNDPNFKRIDVGLKDNCYYPEANHVQSNTECYNSEFLWRVFEGEVRVVYQTPGGTYFTLYSQYWEKSTKAPYPIPLEADYEQIEEYEAEFGVDDVPHFPLPPPDKLAIYRQTRANETWIPLKVKDPLQERNEYTIYTGIGSEDAGKRVRWAPAGARETKRPLMSPVFAMNNENKAILVKGKTVVASNWSNIGLFYFAIEVDVLLSIVAEFERVNNVKSWSDKRARDS